MPKIDTIKLRCMNLDKQRSFYRDILGMSTFDDDTVGYGAEQARLLFIEGEQAYAPKYNDLYWKITIAVADIDLAYQQLKDRGVDIEPPQQFLDIGYLTHLRDPEGFTIEMIDHRFQGNRSQQPLNKDLLGGDPHLNLLTLRCNNIDEVQKSCLDAGMTLLAIMPVEMYGFTLYFFAFTEENPPSSDLSSVANREWLYQRKYTVLEIQHLKQQPEIVSASDHASGYVGTFTFRR